jgi:hypothetical protein
VKIWKGVECLYDLRFYSLFRLHFRALLEDEEQHCLVENRVISPEMAKIPGIESHLKHIHAAKQLSATAEVQDAWSHGTLRRGELQQKYSGEPRLKIKPPLEKTSYNSS